MSELMNTGGRAFRKYLFTTACASALMAAGMANAEEDVRPTVWIELGGQLERMVDSQEILTPSFFGKFDHLHFDPISPLQGALSHSFGSEGKVTFQPRKSDWVLSAAVRFGRSNGHNAEYQRLPSVPYMIKTVYVTGHQIHFLHPPYHLDSAVSTAESHAIVDFKVGRDVGLGMFKQEASSVFSLGVRFAQFTSKRSVNISGVPYMSQHGSDIKYGIFKSHYRNLAAVSTEDSFRGLGPSISWDASAQLVGQGDDAGITLDWSLNAGVLFGRQKVRGETSQTGKHYKTFTQINVIAGIYKAYRGIAESYHNHANLNRSRSVVVPNVGGSAGLSFRYASAKVSFGYRADFFFGAMDGGIDTRETFDRAFYGPFATLSIGLGG